MITEAERMLYKVDTEKIKNFEVELKGKVESTMKLLNKLAENYSFDSAHQIPTDVDAWILKLYLSRNKKAREQYEWQPFKLEGVIIPEDLQQLRSDLKEWRMWQHKEAVAYLLQSKEGYKVNSDLVKKEIDQFAETQKVYIQGEQIVRKRICDDVLRGVEYEVEKSGLDFNSDSMRASLLKGVLSKNPFLTFIGYRLDGKGNRFTTNENYILTGKLNF